MMTFIAIVHILVAIILIALVLLQDSKSNGALGMGGGGSNSVFGATGAQTLAAKMTMWAAIVFAATCLALTYFTSHSQKSVVDDVVLPAATATQNTATPAAPAAEGTTPAADATAPAATPAPASPAPETK
ncbi:MAG: preprotein translocase subunit SecG [Bdellovibrionia bacterium]